MAAERTRRVLLASPGGRRGRGGMASLVTYLADALPQRLPAVRVDILDTYGPGAFWLMPFHFALAILRVIVARMLGRLDLLHVHMACYGSALRKPILARVAIALGVPTVMHLHGADFDDFFRALPRWRQLLLVGVLGRCVRVVVIGHHWRGFVTGTLRLDPAKIVLIHNGAPVPPPRPPRASGSTAKILMLGELGPRKGTPELIQALAAPELKSRAWSAVLAGNGLVDRYKAEAAALGLAERVSIPGWQDAARAQALLDDADIFVLPSRQEGLPMAILEAMARGAAVISTPVGAIPDAITDGETGLLVPPGDAADLARAILRLIDDPGWRALLAANARTRFERMFTIGQTADNVAAMYRELGVG